MTDDRKIVIIGAGPAGLTAAYVLTQRGVASTVLESDTVVGGISRTATADGWRFDIGGHRFFTKVQPVEDLWFEILGAENFLKRPRLSRIYYRGKFYDYPISAMNALKNLGLLEAILCAFSYVWARINPPKDKSTLEGFVVSRFGWRLYGHFFKTQSEKVWGVPCTEIQADWGAQRIKNLSLFRAVWEALKPKWVREGVEVEAGHQPDRGVQLPEVRTGNDVGALRRAHRRGGHQDHVRRGRHEGRARRREGGRGDGLDRRGTVALTSAPT